MEVKCCLKAKRNQNMKKHFIEVKHHLLKSINLNITIIILMYSNFARTYETLLTYDLRIRNTDPCFQSVSCYKKQFLGLK